MGRLREAMRSLLRAGELSPMNTLRNGEMAELYLTLGEEQIVQGLKWDGESSALILRRAQYQFLRKDYAAMVTYLDSKRSYLSEAGRREADALAATAKKLAGIK